MPKDDVAEFFKKLKDLLILKEKAANAVAYTLDELEEIKVLEAGHNLGTATDKLLQIAEATCLAYERHVQCLGEFVGLIKLCNLDSISFVKAVETYLLAEQEILRERNDTYDRINW